MRVIAHASCQPRLLQGVSARPSCPDLSAITSSPPSASPFVSVASSKPQRRTSGFSSLTPTPLSHLTNLIIRPPSPPKSSSAFHRESPIHSLLARGSQKENQSSPKPSHLLTASSPRTKMRILTPLLALPYLLVLANALDPTPLLCLGMSIGAAARSVPYSTFGGARSPFEGVRMEEIERLRAGGWSEVWLYSIFAFVSAGYEWVGWW